MGSCEAQLNALTDVLVKSLFKGKHYDLAILDFGKAFKSSNTQATTRAATFSCVNSTVSCFCNIH